MKRERLFRNNFNRFIVYSLCIIVMFISLLVLSSKVMAQDYDGDYWYYPWDLLPMMSYQYSSMDGYFDQYGVQTSTVDLGMATAQYTYSHMSGASLQNTYAQNPYTNPEVSALPARSRQMLYEFYRNTSGQSNYPGSGPGSNVWVPQYPVPGSPSPTPRKPFPIPDFWPTYNMPDIWTKALWTPMGASPSMYTPDLWSSEGSGLGSSQGSMSGMSFAAPSLWSPQGAFGGMSF